MGADGRCRSSGTVGMKPTTASDSRWRSEYCVTRRACGLELNRGHAAEWWSSSFDIAPGDDGAGHTGINAGACCGQHPKPMRKVWSSKISKHPSLFWSGPWSPMRKNLSRRLELLETRRLPYLEEPQTPIMQFVSAAGEIVGTMPDA